ncbi:class F sortase [Metabacillus indicus]|uniref:class F sortase n=1 Tax=Metabacillus indicus TaxID=246786 RepID=UPI003CED4E21
MESRKKQAAIKSAALILLLAGCAQTGENASPDKKGTRTEQASAVSVSAETSEAKPKPVQQNQTEGINPKSISIPSLNISAGVESAGLTEDGIMELPSNDTLTAWYENGAMPGEQGNAVIAGHVDNKTGPSVFFNLKEINAGDEIIVSGENGEALTFVVQEINSYPYDDAPLPSIFGFSQQRKLNLITCTGEFDRKKKTHLERLVVTGVLKEES